MKLKFGKYKGKTFEYVRKDSPSYFIWLWNKIKFELDKELFEYIEANLNRLKKEAENEHIDFMKDICNGEVCVSH